MGETYTVYQHISPSGKMYFGITSMNPTRRWDYGRGYRHNPYFFNAINKYGWDAFQHIILCSGLTKDEAEQTERDLIATFQTNNQQYGYNITDGGEKGKRHAPSSIEKMRQAKVGKYAGKLNPRFGQPVSEETKQRISSALKGKMVGEKNPNYGRHLSEEQRTAISRRRTGKHYPNLSVSVKTSLACQMVHEKQKKPVEQYTVDGQYVQTWASASDAARYLRGTHCQSNICSCANGKLKTAYGYVWKHSRPREGEEKAVRA